MGHVKIETTHFNPRSREGSDSLLSGWSYTQSDFNPRSREGSDGQGIRRPLSIYKISIHAPAKGATLHCFLVHPAGMISIHAPAKGATPKTRWRNTDTLFQSTLPRRERPARESQRVFITPFQSTLPRRERQKIKMRCGGIRNFNPRSREGSDSVRFPIGSEYPISIHAPAKGATLFAGQKPAAATISIHAPAKGATLYAGHAAWIQPISIHAPAKGATPYGQQPDTEHHYFNPRSREGSDNF